MAASLQPVPPEATSEGRELLLGGLTSVRHCGAEKYTILFKVP